MPVKNNFDPNTFSTRRVVLFVPALLDNGSRSSFTKSNHSTPRSTRRPSFSFFSAISFFLSKVSLGHEYAAKEVS